MENIEKGPFQIKTSFSLLKESFENQLKTGNKAQQLQAKYALSIFENNPLLEKGFNTQSEVEKHKEDVDQLMSFLFPEVLTQNELKSALYPMSQRSFYDSYRMKMIKKTCSENISLNFTSFNVDKANKERNFLPYAIILNKYYGFDIDFDRPTIATLSLDNGKKQKFRATYNGDFLSISPTENAIDITPEILDELLMNTDKNEIWDHYFPPNSWLLEGFAILNLTNITVDEQINTFKEHLIESTVDTSFDEIIEDIRQIFNLPDLVIGATQIKQKFLIRGYDVTIKSLSLFNKEQENIQNLGCQSVVYKLFTQHESVIIPNVEQYDVNNTNNLLRNQLLSQGIKSVAFIPIVINGEVVSLMEIGGNEKNQINAINILKLDDILPFIYSFIKRSLIEFDNQINAIIQEECTSIHPSVKWKFEEEAYRFYIERQTNEHAMFHEIVFEDVIPLYGQIDISGSSEARNKAIQHDLSLLLTDSLDIIKSITETKKLPFYEQLILETEANLSIVQQTFYTNTEQKITDFFEQQLYPVLKYFLQLDPSNAKLNNFLNQLNENNSLYIERKKYDATIDAINKDLANFLDDKQIEAQAIFPHYFQKYKTDGVEHDIYVGQSISPDNFYHVSILYNLRLWQLQIMCEMEARYYSLQSQQAIQLKVASLILAYDSPMSIRYRIDEKKFDVDGAYNVRYEMIKKRIDKAHIKGTTQRLTTPHHLTVVYATAKTEREYLSYFKFLQSKGYIGEAIDIVEVENLQGAVGMKAIRAKINLQLKEAEKVYDFEDLKEQLN